MYKHFLFLFYPRLEQKKTFTFKKLTKKYKNIEYDNWSKMYKKLTFEILPFYLLTFFWLGIGLFTFNWISFIIYILILIIITTLIKLLRLVKIDPLPLFWFESLLFIIFSIFVIINSYHLKLNLFNYFF